ncbi:MAG: hypothetical protein IH849_00290 [Acidobacteria bacterium]|nr:hypothetical protein [Acidobacteriota bacterium]
MSLDLERSYRRARGAIAVLAVCVLTAGALACSGAPAAEEDAAAPIAVETPAAGPAAGTAAPAQAPPVPQKQFPPQDHLNKIVAAYNVANQYPEVLTGLPCYCPCELYGHGSVIDCHRSQHAAMCDICMDEAIEAGQIYQQQLANGVDDIAAAQAQVKDRYRRAVVAQRAQQFPMMNTQQGRAFLQACSDCHQPPHPGMHLPGDWDASLARMEQYARGKGLMQSDQVWQAALEYVSMVSAQVPASTIVQYRQNLETTVEHLKHAEGDAAYYPSVRDPVLDPAWAERVAAAYNAARALPAELLASTPTACQECLDAGNTNILACLNAWQAITCETAIEEVEKLVAEHEQNQ